MKNVFVFSLLLLIISCGKKEDDKEEVVVQENEMEFIIAGKLC